MIIRLMHESDLETLQKLSPPDKKNPMDFATFPTLVATDGEKGILGYTQFTMSPDRTFHYLALRVAEVAQGLGVGTALADARLKIARDAGATMHIAAVTPDGESAMKKILIRQGFHLCQKRPDVWLYVLGCEA